MEERVTKGVRAGIAFFALLVTGFIVSIFVGFVQGDCGSVADPLLRTECVHTQEVTFWVIMTVTLIGSAWAAYLVWSRGE